MIIYHNLSAMNAHRMTKINAFNMDRTMEALASGMRINKARDDAAGLSVSEKMRSQIRGLQQASRNAQDGISFIQTAEGWLNETVEIMQRMRELSVQAANGIYTTEDRMQIQVEVDALVQEVDRIASQAEFNTLRPLFGAFAGTEGAAAVTGDGTANGVTGDPLYYPDYNGAMVFHIGANMDQRVSVFIGNMSAESLKLRNQEKSLSISSIQTANTSIGQIDEALRVVNKQRADLGAYQNRLEHAIRGIDYAAENLQAAESQIRDTDMAKYMADFVKTQILTQSSTSMLAQANMRPQIVLKLLG